MVDTDRCDTCRAERDPDTGWCPHTDAECDRRAGLRSNDSEPVTCVKCGWQLDSRGDCNYCPGGLTLKSDRNTAASRIKRLTPEERADMADVLDAGTSLYDRDVRALIDHATAMDDEVTALRAESMDLHAQIGEWSAKYALDVDALRAERDEQTIAIRRLGAENKALGELVRLAHEGLNRAVALGATDATVLAAANATRGRKKVP